MPPDQIIKYNQGCVSIDLILAWADYAGKEALNRGVSLSADQALQIAMGVSAETGFSQEIVVIEDDGDGGNARI